MNAITHLDFHKEEIISLCKKFGIKKLSLFGSATRENWDPLKSDIDLLAEFGPAPQGVDLFAQHFVFQVELENLLGVAVEVIDWKAAKKPIFRSVVAAEAVPWYAS